MVGCGGAGKSTFACELGAFTSLPVIHLDRFYWRPRWVPTPSEAWKVQLAELVRRDEWIMDGNYTGTLPERVAVADGIVFFDINRVMCVAGVVQRFLGHRFRLRADLPEGCAERLSWEFLRWIWDFPRKFRPAVLAALQQRGADVPLVTIRTRAEAARALARLRRLALGSGGAGSGGWGPSAS